MVRLFALQKKEGDAFAPSDVLCLVETDKATVDFEATEEVRTL